LNSLDNRFSVHFLEVVVVPLGLLIPEAFKVAPDLLASVELSVKLLYFGDGLAWHTQDSLVRLI
jgi:hypothetical protein